MSLEPPPFQEAPRCDVCNCGFNTFKRRHHCRCCGRSLCHEHSSNQMALPQFGVHSCVRVCSDCFNNSSRYAEGDQQGSISAIHRKDDSQTSLDRVDPVADTVSRLHINADPDLITKSTMVQPAVAECNCGMPLCICEAPEPPRHAVDSQRVAVSTYTAKNSKPRRKDTNPKNPGSASNSKLCSVLNPGLLSSNTPDDSQMEYEVNGEGLREAIKNKDAAAVKRLLSKGVDANYRDKLGSSLLHLAALFNQTDIAFALMDHGAYVDFKDSHGETPLDCAPVTLQYKMKTKIEEMSCMGQKP